MWSFSWINKPILLLITGRSERSYIIPPPSSPGNKMQDVLESALQQTRKEFPAAGSYTTSGVPFDSTGTIWIGVRMSKTAYAETNSLFFDQYSGKLLAADLYKNKSTGERVYTKQYDIHAGTIRGWPTKILAFIVSLICASLPVTGFLIWLGRRNKRRGEENLHEA
ncbi:MAG: PepSY protein [Chitinophagaceae bacterium]|nr:PepSY protein [Chitinophagaceae bacterium]